MCIFFWYNAKIDLERFNLNSQQWLAGRFSKLKYNYCVKFGN